MGLKHTDFTLTDEKLARINQYFEERSLAYAQAGEDSVDSAHVTFAWVPGFGRSLTAYFNGEIEGCEIESL